MNLSLNSPDSLLASLYSEVSLGQLIIVSGPSGSGKTSWCLKLARTATNQHIRPKGLVSPAVFLNDEKIAIDLLELDSGENRRLAVRLSDVSSNETTLSKYTRRNWLIDPEVLLWGNKILSNLCVTNELLILDELGPLELLENIGLTAGVELINSRTYQMACVVVRTGLVKNALECWPWAKVIDLTYQVPD